MPCPACGSDGGDPLKRFPDGVLVARCRGCGLLFTPERHREPHGVLAPTSAEELDRTYGPILEARARHYRRAGYRRFVRLLGRYAPGRRLLDVGCAHGFFGREAREAGWAVTGVEPNGAMAAFARERNGLDVLEGRLSDVDLGDRSFDAVTFLDSFEYFPDPGGALRGVAEHLAPGGIVLLKVPNALASLLRLKLERWGVAMGAGSFSPSLRVVHYTPASLAGMARSAGLAPVAGGASPLLHSPPRRAVRAGRAELAPPWYEGMGGRAARRLLSWAGRLEGAVARRDDLAQSIWLVARRTGAERAGS